MKPLTENSTLDELDLITTDQVAKILGVSVRRALDMVNEGYIPVIKFNERVFRYRRTAVIKTLIKMEEGGIL